MDDTRQPAGTPALLLIAIVVGYLLFSGKQPAPEPPPGPDPTPLVEFVRARAVQVSGATAAAERAALAQNYAAVAAEIQTLVDPLSSSTLKRPANAIARVAVLNQNTLGARASAWMPFFDALAARLEQMDAAGQIERSIYAVGEVYAQVAAGLSGEPRGVSPGVDTGDTIGHVAQTAAVRLCAGEPKYDPEREYTSGREIGVYLDQPGQPTWARSAARAGEAEFFEAGGERSAAAFPRSFLGEGAGKRAVYWNYALRFDGDPLPLFAIKQITGNCVEASNGDVTLTHLLGVSIFLLRQPYEFEGPGSVLFYSRRGHCGKGMDLSIAAKAHLEDGAAWRKVYLGGKYDLRDSIADQQLAMAAKHCRNPKSTLADLWPECRKTPVGNVARFTGTAAEAMDILFAGGALHTGSTATASRNGDPVSSGANVGAHAQTCIGYDDTDEFRAWYQQTTGKPLSEPVFVFDQTWGDAPYIQKNWPAHLWGKPTPGMFVLRWSDAKRLIGSTCYAYWPDLRGVTPAALQWRLTHARTGGIGTDSGGGRLAAAGGKQWE